MVKYKLKIFVHSYQSFKIYIHICNMTGLASVFLALIKVKFEQLI